MDPRLQRRINDLEMFLPELEKLENDAGAEEIELKVLEAHLFLAAEGSVENRKSKVRVHPEWEVKAKRVNSAQTSANNAKRIHETNLKKYDGEHLTLKTETPVIKRQGA